MIEHGVVFEEDEGRQGIRVSLSSIEAAKRIDDPDALRLYQRFRKELPFRLVPIYGKNLETVRDRLLRIHEHVYNMLINKIPIHAVRLAWLRLGGAVIGEGSSVWRNTEILGVDNLRIGRDSVIGWHCQVDARAGLVIGDHVCIASHVLIIAGSHDLQSSEFWSVSAPIYIDDYAWIASKALIAHGSHIGRGAVVTANTVVSKVIEPYKIVGGTSAKPMGERNHDLNYKVGGKGLFTLMH